MLGAKYGFAQSTDCAVQTMDPYFARKSMDHANLKGRKVQIREKSMDCAAQTTDCLVRSQVQSKDKLQVSGVTLAS